MPRFLFVVVFVALLAGPGSPAPRPKERPAAATYWPTAVGAVREYQTDAGTETEVVTAVERVGGVTTVTTRLVGPNGDEKPGDKVEIRGDGVYMTEEAGQTYDPPFCLLKLPPKAGAVWEDETTRPDHGKAKLRFVNEAGAVQTVETPAGRFEAVRVAVEDSVGGRRPSRQTVYWYAKEVGLVQIDGIRTLTKYTPGK